MSILFEAFLLLFTNNSHIHIAFLRQLYYNMNTKKKVINMTIGQRIKKRRKELGISADELGLLLGVHRTTIFRYESGYIEKMPIDALEPIAHALGTTPAYLMGWEDVQKSNDLLADIIVHLRTDDSFSEIVKTLHGLDPEKLSGIKIMLDTFLK